MALTLVSYIIFGILGLAFQQFAFMQFVREITPYKRVKRATQLAVLFFTLAWATGLYYYTIFYETFEKSKILAGKYPFVHQYLVEPKAVLLILAPLFSLFFLYLVKVTENTNSKKTKQRAIFVALGALAFGALTLCTEILIGGAAN